MSEDIPDRPTWLDDDFLKTCIRNSQHLTNDSDIQINQLRLGYVCPKGENYMSIVFRVKVKYQVEKGQECEEDFVAKVVHEHEELAKLSGILFDIEIDMYENVVPKMEKILEDNGLKSRFICRYFHRIDDPKVIVLEDLKPQGFVVADRYVGLDKEHCKSVYRKLAEFHAAGMCLFQSKSEEEKLKCSKPIFEETFLKNKSQVSTQRQRIESNIKEMEQHNNKYKKSIEFLRKYDELLDIPKPDSSYAPGGKFNAITHSDCWVNNIMFKYKEDKTIDDLLFVDLQLCYYNSVTYDFLSFLFSSTTLEIRKNHYNELKEFYFYSLVRNLKRFNYKGEIPTMSDFEVEMKRMSLIAIFSLVYMLPIVLHKLDKDVKSREESDAISFEDVTNMMQNGQNNTDYRDKMLASFDLLQDNGFMDTFPIPPPPC